MKKRTRNKIMSVMLAAMIAVTGVVPAEKAAAAEALPPESAPTADLTEAGIAAVDTETASVLAADEGSGTQTTEYTSKISCDGNRIRQDYSTYGSTIKSYLVPCVDETNNVEKLMRVQYVASGGSLVVAEYYDPSDYKLLEESKIINENENADDLLPIFGGFYEMNGSYFLLTGQRNMEENPETEVFRVTKYDKDWKKVGSVGLKNCNTTIPFDAGSARMTAVGKYLVIRTCHSMYKAYDGYRHQANMMFQVDTEEMKVTAQSTGVSFSGYVSHSFNQFIQNDNNKIAALDHGDTYPRAIQLYRYNQSAANGTYGSASSNTMLSLAKGSYFGDNKTGASVGAFEISDTSYLAAGNRALEGKLGGIRNVFVAAADKNNTSQVKINWLTNYEEHDNKEENVSASTPHMVKVDTDKYMVLWTEKESIRYTLVNGNGEQIDGNRQRIDDDTGIHKIEKGNLSDCVPIVVNDKLVWYAWSNSNIGFYEIDVNTLELTKITDDEENIVNTPTPIASSGGSSGSNNSSSENLAPPLDPSSNGTSGGSSSNNTTQTPNTTSSEYIIDFNANGGTIVGSNMQVTTNHRLTSMPSAVRNGYTFQGWYTQASGGTLVTTWTLFSSHTTVYAQWRDKQAAYNNFNILELTDTAATLQMTMPLRYIKSWKYLLGTARDQMTEYAWNDVNEQRDMIVVPLEGLLPNTTYYFSIYYISDSSRVDLPIQVFTTKQKVSKECTISFQAAGGEVIGSATMTTVDQKLPALPSASRSGYTFDGWYTGSGGGTKITTSTLFATSGTVYAHWTKIEQSSNSTTTQNVSVKKMKIGSVKSPSKGSIKVRWTRYYASDGYQIACSKNKKFPSGKTKVKTAKAASTAKTITGLSKGKTYYVRMRAYKKVNGKKYYGAWSSVKKIKTKK